MALDKYITPGETLKISFRMSLRWILILIITSSLIFGGLTFFFWGDDFLVLTLGILWGLIIAYLLIYYFSIIYFVTNQKIYKKSGIVWSKIEAAKIKEITDVLVVQTAIEALLYGTGTIKINTAGTTKYEIVMQRVAAPFERRKSIYALFGT